MQEAAEEVELEQGRQLPSDTLVNIGKTHNLVNELAEDTTDDKLIEALGSVVDLLEMVEMDIAVVRNMLKEGFELATVSDSLEKYAESRDRVEEASVVIFGNIGDPATSKYDDKKWEIWDRLRDLNRSLLDDFTEFITLTCPGI